MRITATEDDVQESTQPLGVLRRSFLLGTPGLLTACAVTPAAVDGAAAAPGRGYLAMQLVSNQLANLSFNKFGKPTFSSQLEDGLGGKGGVQFVSGERSVMVEVQAGEYMWTLLSTGHRQATVEATRFQVLAGAITYIGRLQLQLSSYNYQLRVADQEAQMLDYLRANYPLTLQNLPFHKAISQLRLKAA
jgi:hypothetical protein